MARRWFIRMACSKAFSEVVSAIYGNASSINRPVMRLLAALLIAVTAMALSSPVDAKPRDVRPVTFSAEDEQIIARNEALSQLVKKNPQAVRRVLDLIDNAHLPRTKSPQVEGSDEGQRRTAVTKSKSFDPKS